MKIPKYIEMHKNVAGYVLQDYDTFQSRLTRPIIRWKCGKEATVEVTRSRANVFWGVSSRIYDWNVELYIRGESRGSLSSNGLKKDEAIILAVKYMKRNPCKLRALGQGAVSHRARNWKRAKVDEYELAWKNKRTLQVLVLYRDYKDYVVADSDTNEVIASSRYRSDVISDAYKYMSTHE